jgi:hypothetical protein
MEWKLEAGQRISFEVLTNGRVTKGRVFVFGDEPQKTKFLGSFPVPEGTTAKGLPLYMKGEAELQGRVARQDGDLPNVFWIT